MTTKFDKFFWDRPIWFHYAIAVLLALFAVYIRLSLSPFFEDRTPYGLSLIPVAIAAYIGGFGPGMVTSIIGMGASFYLFVSAANSAAIKDPYASANLAIFFTVCLFINVVAGRLRKSARRNARLVEQIETERQVMKEVLASVSDAYYAVDSKWRLVQHNPAFLKFVKSDSIPPIGRKLWELFPDHAGTPVYNLVERVMKTRTADGLEVEDKESDSWYYVRAFPTKLGMSVFIQDITERKALEHAREQMLSEERVARNVAEEAGRMKEEFLATLSHELRTPMTSLLGWANLLNRENVSPERMKEGLASIEASAQVQSKLVDELLDLSRINAGKLRVEMEFLTLAHIADEAVKLHEPAASAKGIQIKVEHLEEEVLVRGDSSRLHQVFANIISNAIKFTPRGGKVVVRTFPEGSTACFLVQDSGEGIPKEMLPLVFERFRQGNSTYSRRFGGLGLGLSIAKQLIELHGGSIEAKSEGEGKGSEFRVCLPLALLHRPLVVEPLEPQDRLDLRMKRILLVEDDPSTRLMLQRLLEEYNAVVLSAPDAQTGLDAVSTFKPDAILSDIGLPQMDGCAFMKLVRARGDEYGAVPAIALTAFATEKDKRTATEAGFSAFMTKPVNAPLLLKTIRDLVLN